MKHMFASFATLTMVMAVSGPAFSGALSPQPQFSSPIAGGASSKPLPEAQGVVSWMTLAQVEQVKVKNRFVAQFSDTVTALDNKEVRLQGFMMPLETGNKQKHFLLSARPVTCGFCLPGGAEALIEVKTKVAVAQTFGIVVISGKMAVLKDDPTGLYYRLTDAVLVSK
jgi:hypothetical protein